MSKPVTVAELVDKLRVTYKGLVWMSDEYAVPPKEKGEEGDWATIIDSSWSHNEVFQKEGGEWVRIA